MRWYQILISGVFVFISLIGGILSLIPLSALLSPPEGGGLGAIIGVALLFLVGLVYGSIMLGIGALACYGLGRFWNSKRLRSIGKIYGAWLLLYWMTFFVIGLIGKLID